MNARTHTYIHTYKHTNTHRQMTTVYFPAQPASLHIPTNAWLETGQNFPRDFIPQPQVQQSPQLQGQSSKSAAYHIIGGGPVGICMALLLAKQGLSSVVYEGRAHIVHIPEESYPIGVNARGMDALRQISEDLAAKVQDSGRIVDAWQIFGGKYKVAEEKSGVVVGTSRGMVNKLLAQVRIPVVAREFASKRF
jgi:hypothetical protein